MSSERVMFVDDDQATLDTYERLLMDHLPVETALGPREGLERIQKNGPYAVVVSDLRMPEMDGIEFLMEVKKRHPQTVAIILTGNADLTAAIAAVNTGQVFRFLTKPCPPAQMVEGIASGIKQYRLERVEGELLDQTLKGCVKVLTDIIEAIHPQVFASSEWMRESITALAWGMDISETWELEMAAMLVDIGMVVVPAGALDKFKSGMVLTREENRLFATIPELSQKLVGHIPRMENVARIISCVRMDYNAGRHPENGAAGNDIPLGARMLRIIRDLRSFRERNASLASALRKMQEISGVYDPDILKVAIEVFGAVQTVSEDKTILQLTIQDLHEGDVVLEDVKDNDGVCLVRQGTRVTRVIIQRLRIYNQLMGLECHIKVDRRLK